MSHSRHAAVGVYYRFYLVANKEMVMKGEIKMFGEGLEGLGKVGQHTVVNASGPNAYIFKSRHKSVFDTTILLSRVRIDHGFKRLTNLLAIGRAITPSTGGNTSCSKSWSLCTPYRLQYQLSCSIECSMLSLDGQVQLKFYCYRQWLPA